MKPVMKNTKACSQQQGAALVVGLIMLLLLTLIGVAGMRDTLLQQKMVANTKDREVALQAAEAALQEAEARLRLGVGTEELPMGSPGLYDAVNPSIKASFDAQRAASSSEADFWKNRSWNSSNSVTYSLALNGVAVAPRYVIERVGCMTFENPLPLADPYCRLSMPAADSPPTTPFQLVGLALRPPGGRDGGGGGTGTVECEVLDPNACVAAVASGGGKTIDYRITARGVGATPGAVVILQAVLRRLEQQPATP